MGQEVKAPPELDGKLDESRKIGSLESKKEMTRRFAQEA